MLNVHVSRLLKFAAIAAVAGTTLMQGAEQGKFHLPFEARWGQAVLEPGDYSINTPEPSLGVTQFRVIDSKGKSLFELRSDMENQKSAERSWLKLNNVNGEYVVREYSSGSSGRTYTFPVPRATQRQISAAKSTQNSVALMVR